MALAGVLAAIHYYRVGLTLAHYDARAHLVVARRVLDSLTPGWQQIGAVWLPLPHLLNLLPVQVDAWYRTGASGVAISAGYQPEVGEVVIIGKITGSVVRIFDAGFAVHFFERQDAASVESLLGAPQEWREAARLSATGPYDPVQPVLVGTET